MIPSLQLRVVVSRIHVEAEDIASYELVSSDGTALPRFSAGSHIDVAVPGGFTRQYSLCNNPDETHRYLIAVLKDARSRGGSVAMHEQLRTGDSLYISSPRNHFSLAHEAQASLLLAGGIGVTPLLCMAERLALTNSKFALHYCTRSPARTAFKERIENSPLAPHTHFHFDDGPEEQRLDMNGLLANHNPGQHLYVCGPAGFMDAVLSMARQSGWPEGQVHYEFFAGSVTRADTDAGFEVQLASTGSIVRVAKDQTVLQALFAAGVEIPASCEQGVCGTCLTRVLQGVPDHRDAYLTPDEQAANDQFLPCCSRSLTSMLVLDI